MQAKAPSSRLVAVAQDYGDASDKFAELISEPRGGYSTHFALTKAGRHTLHVNLACCGGLQAAFAFSQAPVTGTGMRLPVRLSRTHSYGLISLSLSKSVCAQTLSIQQSPTLDAEYLTLPLGTEHCTPGVPKCTCTRARAHSPWHTSISRARTPENMHAHSLYPHILCPSPLPCCVALHRRYMSRSAGGHYRPILAFDQRVASRAQCTDFCRRR
jgi:hypothetical protein